VIQNAAERVVGIGVSGGILDRFADGDAQAARRVGMLGQHRAPRIRFVARAGINLRAPGVHEHFAVRFLVKADLHHVDGAVHAKHAAGERQRAAPLAGAGFGGQAADPGLLVVVSLSHGCVRLMAAGRADAFVFVINMGGRIEGRLQAPRSVQRRGAP